jgi:hypothetical protein
MTVPLLTLMVLIVAFGAALRQAQGRLADGRSTYIVSSRDFRALALIPQPAVVPTSKDQPLSGTGTTGAAELLRPVGAGAEVIRDLVSSRGPSEHRGRTF